jgi:hypothetical protein
LQGTVTDPSQSAVPNVTVELKNVATSIVRTTTTATSEGIFRFNSVVPAVYDLTIRPPAGFKEYVQKQITLNASEIRELGRISLTVGAVNETVQVTAAATAGPDRFERELASGRFRTDGARHGPGTRPDVALADHSRREFWNYFPNPRRQRTEQLRNGEPFAPGALNLNGMGSQANYTVDGVTSMDTAGDSLTTFSPNVDAVAEVQPES